MHVCCGNVGILRGNFRGTLVFVFVLVCFRTIPGRFVWLLSYGLPGMMIHVFSYVNVALVFGGVFRVAGRPPNVGIFGEPSEKNPVWLC